MTHTTRTRGLRIALAGLLMMGSISVAGADAAQSVAPEETTRSVRRMLERLPYYGAFDFIAFGVDGGTVTLVGYSFHATLKAEAEMVTRMAAGVKEVANKIEVLPPSQSDDRIRWATYYRIYTDGFLSRYVSGGAQEALRQVLEESRFLGMQPIGSYPIHIIVKNGRTMLLGAVDTAVDRQLAEVRAREVGGVFEVENSLTVAGTR